MSDDEVDVERRRFLATTTTLLGGVGVAFAAVPFISSWNPSQKAQALGAPVTVDISQLAMGQLLTIQWRGKPVWIVHRSDSMLAGLTQIVPKLRDPESLESQQPAYCQNSVRAIKAPILVVMGLCTHLGCVPIYRPQQGELAADWQGGFYCPCHGSYYDLAGRVYRAMPAPTNLSIPPHQYISDNELLIGEDGATHA